MQTSVTKNFLLLLFSLFVCIFSLIWISKYNYLKLRIFHIKIQISCFPGINGRFRNSVPCMHYNCFLKLTTWAPQPPLFFAVSPVWRPSLNCHLLFYVKFTTLIYVTVSKFMVGTFAIHISYLLSAMQC